MEFLESSHTALPADSNYVLKLSEKRTLGFNLKDRA
jgi:hypothetical protein